MPVIFFAIYKNYWNLPRRLLATWRLINRRPSPACCFRVGFCGAAMDPVRATSAIGSPAREHSRVREEGERGPSRSRSPNPVRHRSRSRSDTRSPRSRSRSMRRSPRGRSTFRGRSNSRERTPPRRWGGGLFPVPPKATAIEPPPPPPSFRAVVDTVTFARNHNWRVYYLLFS